MTEGLQSLNTDMLKRFWDTIVEMVMPKVPDLTLNWVKSFSVYSLSKFKIEHFSQMPLSSLKKIYLDLAFHEQPEIGRRFLRTEPFSRSFS